MVSIASSPVLVLLTQSRNDAENLIPFLCFLSASASLREILQGRVAATRCPRPLASYLLSAIRAIRGSLPFSSSPRISPMPRMRRG